MVSCRFGGSGGVRLTFDDQGDLVVIRTRRRGARHDVSPLAATTRTACQRLAPLFGFPAAGVGVYEVREGRSEEIAPLIDGDPEVQFGGRGLRDEYGAPVVYTENLFVKFTGEASEASCKATLSGLGLTVKRPLAYAENTFFAGGPERIGREIFSVAEELLARDDVELCHPELVRERTSNRAFPEQWHLQDTLVDGRPVDADANVVGAWQLSEGAGVVVAVIDDGVDIDHEEFSTPGKLVAPRSFAGLDPENPRPGDGDNHGTACAGVACADGRHGASGVAPRARLMPIRMVSGLGSQDEADAFVWAADHGAQVISCSWGPMDGEWWNPNDPQHDQVVPLPDSTRLAIDYATATGRGGRGCVITWAAGNGDESVDNDGYASCGKVIAVAACNDVGTKSAYSDHGRAIWCCFPSSHGEPSLTKGIWTTDRSGPEGRNPGNTTLGDAEGDYLNSFGGTSSACPGVAGVAALVLARNPELRWEQVRDVIRRSCDRIDDLSGEYDADGHSRNYGYGRVNAAAAVEVAAGLRAAPPPGQTAPSTEEGASVPQIDRHMNLGIGLIEPSATVVEAATRMTREETSSLAVVESSRVVAVLTDRDVVTSVGSNQDPRVVTVREAASPLIAAPAGLDAEDALRLMDRNGADRILVVAEDGHLVGIVSEEDIRSGQALPRPGRWHRWHRWHRAVRQQRWHRSLRAARWHR